MGHHYPHEKKTSAGSFHSLHTEKGEACISINTAGHITYVNNHLHESCNIHQTLTYQDRYENEHFPEPRTSNRL